jgi:hypothetical protein
MKDPVPFTDALDGFLQEVVRALHAAVTLGTRISGSDPAGADKVLDDCKVTLDVIMAGRVEEWVSS